LLPEKPGSLTPNSIKLFLAAWKKIDGKE